MIGSIIPIAVLHFIYWPNILQICATWLPVNLTPFLDPFRLPIQSGSLPGTSDIVVPYLNKASRILAFLLWIRFHFFTIVGFSVCLFLWLRRNELKSQNNRRIAWFLATLFLVLTLIHAWASFLQSIPYCTFCFTPYLAFFDFIAFLLIAASISSWNKSISRIKQAAIILFIIFVSSCLVYAAYDMLGPCVLSI